MLDLLIHNATLPDGHTGMAGRHIGVAACIQHHLPPRSIGPHDEQAVRIKNGMARRVKSQEGGTVGFFLHGATELTENWRLRNKPARIPTMGCDRGR